MADAHLRIGSVAGLRSLRAAVGECLARGSCSAETIADAQLVLAEVATNAFVHDAAPLVDVQVTCRADEIELSTWHRGDVAPPPHPVVPMPVIGPMVAAGGRGLAIVDRIVVSRVVANTDGCTTTVARLRR
ncbi:MAG: ATP-binding protein [Acidimicrobiia bacterium]